MKDDHVAVLPEDIQSQIQRLAEAMVDVPGDVRQLKESISHLKEDMKVVRALAKDHETRITTLKTA